MGASVLVVSLGRLIADQVRVEPQEACAVLVRLWDHVARTRSADGALAPVPSLDAVGITAFGDLEVRRDAVAHAPRRHPEVVAREMAMVLRRLLASGRDTLATLPAQVVAACRAPERRRLGPEPSPAALLEALAPYRPPDPSDALAMVFARWMRVTDGGAIRGASDRSDA